MLLSFDILGFFVAILPLSKNFSGQKDDFWSELSV